MSPIRRSKSTPDSIVPSTSSLAPKTPLNSWNFLVEELVDPGVGLVVPVEEVDDHYIVLLTVAVAATDPLLDPLRVPGQVEVDDQRAELEVDPFRPGLGRDHDLTLVPEVVDQGGSACRPCGSR